MIHRVELIYDDDCPNAGLARERLKEALARSGLMVAPTEWLRTSPGTPEHVRGWGSPTILVDGRDVAGQQPSESPTCRIYPNPRGGFDRAPSLEQIMAVLGESHRPNTGGTVRRLLPVAPGLAAAFLPVLSCPACWPAYAGVLSSLGVPFLGDERITLPLVGLLLLVAVASLSWRARQRRGFGPAILGLASSAIVIAGRVGSGSVLFASAGALLLLGASLWNVWPMRSASRNSCCSPEEGSSCDGGKPS